VASAPQNPAAAAPADVASRVVRGGGALLVRHVVALVVNAAGGIVLARRLGPESMGLVFTAVTALAIARQWTDFGVRTWLIRQSDSERSIAACFWLQSALAAIALVAVAVVVASGALAQWAPRHGAALAVLLWGAVVGAAATVLQAPAVAALERRHDWGRIGRFEVAEPIVFTAVAVWATTTAAPMVWIAVALALRGWVPALLAWRAAGARIAAPPARGAILALARELWPLTASQAVMWGIQAAPPLVIGRLAGVAALGQAQLAYSLLGSAGLAAAVLHRLSYATLARFQDDAARFDRTVAWALNGLAVAYAPALFALASLSPLWVPRVCGPEWEPVQWVLLVGALPVSLAALLGVYYGALLVRGRHALALGQNLVHWLLYVAALVVASRAWGALALPVAHLVAMPAGVLYVRAYRRLHGTAPGAAAAAVVLACAVIAVATFAAARAGHAVVAVGAWVVVLAVLWAWAVRRFALVAMWRRLAAEDAR